MNDFIYLRGCNKDVINYLEKSFRNININIIDGINGSIFDLMTNGNLEGYCWQTFV